MLQFRVLGPLEAARDDETVPLRGALQRRLLAILLLRANEVVPPDRIADELWSGAPPATATTALQVQVSRLRQALEPDRGTRAPGTMLVTTAAGYRLQLRREQVDALRFEDLVGRGRTALHAGRLEEAVALLEEALGLWRGPALPEVAGEPFAQGAVVRWGELRAAAEEERMEAELGLGRHTAVVDQLEDLAKAEPLRERRTGHLMVALYRCGRQTEALRAFRRLRTMLIEELGLEPGPELQALEQAILDHDLPAAPVAAGGTSAAADATARVTPFTGREAEMGRAMAALDAALGGDSQVLFVAGEPGIGKSRLAEEVAAAASARGVSVWSGRCYEDAGAAAYWPWVQVLRAARADMGPEAFLSGLGDEAAIVAQVAPGAGLGPRVAAEPALGAEQARFRLFDAIATVLGRLAATARPVLIVLDDLHWADIASLRLLRFIVGQLPVVRPRLLLLGLFRDAEVGPDLADALADASREACVTRILLDGLASAEVARLVASAGGADALGEVVHRKTDGNPLFVREVLRLLEVEGRLETAAGGDLGVPATVREIVAGRTRRVSEEARRALALASVAGARFDVGLLERVSGTDTDALLDALEEATRAGVIVEDTAAPGVFRFSHDLVREAVYLDLSARRRARIHFAVGQAAVDLRRSGGRDVRAAELAHHFVRAGLGGEDPEPAQGWSEAAAAEATAALAYEEAVAHLQRAVEAEERRPPDAARRAGLLIALGNARWRAGEVEPARDSFLQAADVARAAGEAELLADAALGVGGGPYNDWHATRGIYGGRVVDLLEEALTMLGEGDSPRRVAVLGRLAEELYYADHDRRLALSAEAVEQARRLGDAETVVSALCSRCAATWDPDHLEGRLALSAEIVTLAACIGSRELGLFGRHYLFAAQLEHGDVAAAFSTLDEFEALAGELRQPLYVWAAAWFRAMQATVQGRFADAERLAHEAFEIGARTGDPDALAIFGVQIGAIRFEQDRIAEIHPVLQDFAGEFAESPAWQAAVCLTAADLGWHDEARAVLAGLAPDRFAALPRDFAWLAALAMLAQACALVDEAGPAWTIHELLLPFASRNLMTADRNCWGSSAHYLGLTATTAGRFDDADHWFAQALSDNTRWGFRPWAAHTRHQWAVALRRRGGPGDSARAKVLLEEAGRDASAMDMVRLVRLVDQTS